MKTGLTTLPLMIQKCHKLAKSALYGAACPSSWQLREFPRMRVGRIARNGSPLPEGVIAAAKRAIISTT